MDLKQFGDKIRHIREAKGFTINKAAQLAFMGAGQLKMVEEATVQLRITTLFKISEGWGVPIVEFFEPLPDKRKKGG